MNNPIKPQSLDGLEKRIGYTFKNREYITVALTHSSYSNEMKAKGQKTPFNERLEFLGDSVLSIVVSSYIFDKYKNKQEGDLTKIRAAVVCEKALAKYANAISLGEYMFTLRVPISAACVKGIASLCHGVFTILSLFSSKCPVAPSTKKPTQSINLTFT